MAVVISDLSTSQLSKFLSNNGLDDEIIRTFEGKNIIIHTLYVARILLRFVSRCFRECFGYF
jgi:hypothetical protein